MNVPIMAAQAALTTRIRGIRTGREERRMTVRRGCDRQPDFKLSGLQKLVIMFMSITSGCGLVIGASVSLTGFLFSLGLASIVWALFLPLMVIEL